MACYWVHSVRQERAIWKDGRVGLWMSGLEGFGPHDAQHDTMLTDSVGTASLVPLMVKTSATSNSRLEMHLKHCASPDNAWARSSHKFITLRAVIGESQTPRLQCRQIWLTLAKDGPQSNMGAHRAQVGPQNNIRKR